MYGRKHCYRLYTKLLNEATRWSSAIQNVTDTKAPIDTPTQQLIQDIKVRWSGASGWCSPQNSKAAALVKLRLCSVIKTDSW